MPNEDFSIAPPWFVGLFYACFFMLDALWYAMVAGIKAWRDVPE